MQIGCHISIRGGYAEAAKLAHRMGAGAYQYFPKNPRGLSVKTIDRKDANACAAYCQTNRLLSIAHTPYPTNLAIDDPIKRETVRQSLLNDLEIAEACGSIGVVVHFGVYKGTDTLQGYKNILQLLNDVISEWNGRTLLLIENQAGEGTTMGLTFEEMVQIRRLCMAPEKVGFCLDTCHLFASGVWTGSNWAELVDKGRRLDYFQHLRAVHLNDSVYPTGARKDRHANIGRGHIGEAAILEALRTPEFAGIPVVLETPTFENYSHEEELRYLMGLMNIGHME
jgi:deoxyribonuclease IV